MIEFCQSPINESQLTLFVINHDIMGFDVTVHDSIRMAIVQSLQKLKDVIPNVEIGQSWIQNLEVGVVDMFKDK
jgi:hypothetical protein